jgi:hypothetical protein
MSWNQRLSKSVLQQFHSKEGENLLGTESPYVRPCFVVLSRKDDKGALETFKGFVLGA